MISQSGRIKLADFGLARIYQSVSQSHNSEQENKIGERQYSHQVATRWYRSPELLYGSKTYDFTVDIWSAGAVIGELMLLRPLFPGNSDIDQMAKVFQVMGTPSPSTWPVSCAPSEFTSLLSFKLV